jgi:hypothetical protein
MLEKSEFMAPYGSFRKRHEIMFYEICGEAGDVCKKKKAIADWFAKHQIPLLNRTCL